MLKNIIFFGCIAAFFFSGLGAYPLLNNNEGLYAQIAWEMLETGDYIIPHLNGVPYIEKPPLLYWLIAGSFKLFGKSVFSARLIPALFGMLTSLSLYLFARSLHQEKGGKYAAFLLTTCCGFIIFSRMVFFDVVLTFFLTAAAFTFYKLYQTEHKKYLYLFSAFMAAAVLTKGLVALVLTGGLILSFLLIERNLLFLKYFFDPLVIGIFFSLTLPWHILACLKEEGFAWFYFVNEHWMRFLDKRIPRDYYTGPFYYYMPRLLGYLVPWTFLAPFFLRKSSVLTSSLNKFLGCWFFSFLLFFSLSRAKANYYMVVGLPPLALWMGAYLSTYSKRILVSGVAAIFSASLMIVGVMHVQQKQDLFSVKKSLSVIPAHQSLYLYKRFEELSSLPFYAGGPIPIIESESQDLWYGQQTRTREDLFLSVKDSKEGSKAIYVMTKDKEDFLKKYEDKQPKTIYTSSYYAVFAI